jgi:pimeloyl-ACP methyl ester carboxylesterase
VLAPDFHGHGDGPPMPRMQASIVAADTERIAQLVMAEPAGVHLVGHSYGAAIALRVARRCGDRVRSIALVEPVAFRILFDHAGRRRPAAEVLEIGRSLRVLVRVGRPERAAERFVGYWGGSDAWTRLGPDARAAVALRMDAVSAHFESLAADDFSLDACRAIHAPALLLAGMRTRAPALRIAELVASALPDVRDERLADADHIEALVSPGRIVARIAAFVLEIEARNASALRVAA